MIKAKFFLFVLMSFSTVSEQKYDPELFKMAMPCLSAIAGALPPDYVDASMSTTVEKPVSVDTQGNFDPKPINTAKWGPLKQSVETFVPVCIWVGLTLRVKCHAFSLCSIALPEKLEHFANKYGEHSHEKWSAEKVRARMKAITWGKWALNCTEMALVQV